MEGTYFLNYSIKFSKICTNFYRTTPFLYPFLMDIFNVSLIFLFTSILIFLEYAFSMNSQAFEIAIFHSCTPNIQKSAKLYITPRLFISKHFAVAKAIGQSFQIQIVDNIYQFHLY